MAQPSTSSASAPEPVRLSAGGTTIGGAKSNKITDVLALEYVTFRVPYEELNMKFRRGQKEMEKAAANVAKTSSLITEMTANSNAGIPKEQLARKFQFLRKQVRDAQETFERICKEQIQAAEKIKRRCELLNEELLAHPSNGPRRFEQLERQKYSRYVIWHLMRCGYVDAAKAMVEELKMEEMIDIELFEGIHAVESSLIKDRDTAPAYRWIEQHKSKLRRIGSRLEIVIRQLDIVDMIEKDQLQEAIVYVKKYLTPIAKASHAEDLKQTMCAIACTYDQSKARFPELHAVDRFEKAAEIFIAECYKVYEIHGDTPFTIILECGLAAFKTPLCHCDESVPPGKLKCFVCRPDIWPLAEHLPYAACANSRILCSMTNALCNDDDNKPYMFPSGHVFGAKAIDKYLRRPEKRIYDPVHKQVIEENEILRLYFL